jgi:phosphopantetheinyl transferase
MDACRVWWAEENQREGQSAVALVRFMRTSTLEEFALAARASALFSPDERTAAARWPADPQRRDILATHVLARCMLSEACGCDPGTIVLGASPLGQPEVLLPARAVRYRVSLAHADGIALAAIAEECSVGVDVQSLRAAGPDPQAAAGTVLSRDDLAALRRLEPHLRTGRFLMLWTRMEALARARGVAFSCAPGALATDAGGAWRPPAPHGSETEVADTEGRVESWRVTPDHVAAVAILGRRSRSIRIRLEEVATVTPASAASAHV